jgi:hypothetical protein
VFAVGLCESASESGEKGKEVRVDANIVSCFFDVRILFVLIPADLPAVDQSPCGSASLITLTRNAIA